MDLFKFHSFIANISTKWNIPTDKGATAPGPALLVARRGHARKKKNSKEDFLILSSRNKQEGKESTLLN